MKKVHKVSLLAISIIVAITFLFIGCNKEDLFKKADNNQAQKSGLTNKATSTGTCACDAAPSGCSSKFKKCSKQLLNNGDSRDFVINWTSATACGNKLPPKTYGHLCYTGSCNEFYLELTSSIPLCLSCYPEPYCVKATSVSFSSKCAFSLQYTSDDGTQVITITGDPHISIQCSPVSGISSTCDGDLTWL